MSIFISRKYENKGNLNPEKLIHSVGLGEKDASNYFTQYADEFDKSDDYNSFGDAFDIVNIRVQELREFYGLTITETADALNMDRSNYRRLERFGWNFDRKSLYKICLFYEIDTRFIFGYSKTPNVWHQRPIDDRAIMLGLIKHTAQELWEQKNPDKI